jgi:IS5 family transposase
VYKKPIGIAKVDFCYSIRTLEHQSHIIRAKVEHQFRVIKCQFDHCKVRYRGIFQNTSQLMVIFAQSNLCIGTQTNSGVAGMNAPTSWA